MGVVTAAEDQSNNLIGEEDEDDFFRQINEIKNEGVDDNNDKQDQQEEEDPRGRPRTRDEIVVQNRTRKSRWEQPTSSPDLLSIPKSVPLGLTDKYITALIVRLRIEEITKKLTLPTFEIPPERDRSPSPPPIYDNNGKRINTREQRHKDKLNKERHNLVLAAQQINPNYRPPSDYQPPNEKKTCKIYIPIKQHPEYNFIGLIIGPRGNTQKRLEKESGAKIAIRGVGSNRDGKSTKPQYQENDELHVLLTADTQEQLDKASILVKEFLVPVEEGKNEHKRQQLRELAEMNGTLRERPAFMPNRSWAPADIKCVHCGEVSHPSNDCPLKGSDQVNLHQIETEYNKFLQDITEILGFNPDTLNGNGGDDNESGNNNNNNRDNNGNNDDEFDSILNDFDNQLTNNGSGNNNKSPQHGMHDYNNYYQQQQHHQNNHHYNQQQHHQKSYHHQSPPQYQNSYNDWNSYPPQHGMNWNQDQSPPTHGNSPYGPPPTHNSSPYGPPSDYMYKK
eukprot:gene3923-4898_t